MIRTDMVLMRQISALRRRRYDADRTWFDVHKFGVGPCMLAGWRCPMNRVCWPT